MPESMEVLWGGSTPGVFWWEFLDFCVCRRGRGGDLGVGDVYEIFNFFEKIYSRDIKF